MLGWWYDLITNHLIMSARRVIYSTLMLHASYLFSVGFEAGFLPNSHRWCLGNKSHDYLKITSVCNCLPRLSTHWLHPNPTDSVSHAWWLLVHLFLILQMFLFFFPTWSVNIGDYTANTHQTTVSCVLETRCVGGSLNTVQKPQLKMLHNYTLLK